jgi:hypothetical protein
VLHKALKTAIKWRILVRNSADAVEPPRIVKREMRTLDEAETALLLGAAAESPLYAPILSAVTTGLRRGELLGLKWGVVDLSRRILYVRRSVEQTKGTIQFKDSKGRGEDGYPFLLYSPTYYDCIESDRISSDARAAMQIVTVVSSLRGQMVKSRIQTRSRPCL